MRLLRVPVLALVAVLWAAAVARAEPECESHDRPAFCPVPPPTAPPTFNPCSSGLCGAPDAPEPPPKGPSPEQRAQMCIEKAEARAAERKQLNASDEVECLKKETGVSSAVIVACLGLAEAPPAFFACLGISAMAGTISINSCEQTKENEDRRVELDLEERKEDCGDKSVPGGG